MRIVTELRVELRLVVSKTPEVTRPQIIVPIPVTLLKEWNACKINSFYFRSRGAHVVLELATGEYDPGSATELWILPPYECLANTRVLTHRRTRNESIILHSLCSDEILNTINKLPSYLLQLTHFHTTPHHTTPHNTRLTWILWHIAIPEHQYVR